MSELAAGCATQVFKMPVDLGSIAAMFNLWHLPLLFLTGLVAGFVDSIAGGGGLITVPVLLSFGLDPQQALGTNKLQATFGSGSASWHYAQAKNRLAQRLCCVALCSRWWARLWAPWRCSSSTLPS